MGKYEQYIVITTFCRVEESKKAHTHIDIMSIYVLFPESSPSPLFFGILIKLSLHYYCDTRSVSL